MALWWTSKVAGADGDELSGWSVATRSRGSDTVGQTERQKERERCAAHRWGGGRTPGGGGTAAASARRSSALTTSYSGAPWLR
jgi:hypothetical protein